MIVCIRGRVVVRGSIIKILGVFFKVKLIRLDYGFNVGCKRNLTISL